MPYNPLHQASTQPVFLGSSYLNAPRFQHPKQAVLGSGGPFADFPAPAPVGGGAGGPAPLNKIWPPSQRGGPS